MTASQEDGLNKSASSSGITPENRYISNRSRRRSEVAARRLKIEQPGRYAVRLRYDNHVHNINTGVTNAVKRVKIMRGSAIVANRIVQMPHVRPVNGRNPLAISSSIYTNLGRGSYSIVIEDHFNMNSLYSNATYSGPGGSSGAVNEANVASIDLDLIATESQ